MEMKLVDIKIPEGINVILGQSHFIKTVEDLYETIAESGLSIRFGLAFCEASAKRLIRSDGNDKELISLAEQTALKIGAGHSFVIFLKEGFPVNIVNRIQSISEVVSLYAATANSLQIVMVETQQGRGILGVIDGETPLGIEKDEDKKERKDFLRKIGYKR